MQIAPFKNEQYNGISHVREQGRALAKKMREDGRHVYCRSFTPTPATEGSRILAEYAARCAEERAKQRTGEGI